MKTGIYFLIKRKKVVYVGQTIAFPKRLSGHCSKDFDSVRFIQCSKKHLTKYEDRWIRLFRPKLNTKNAKADEGKPYILRIPVDIYNEVVKRAETMSRSVNGQIVYELNQTWVEGWNQENIKQAWN